MESRIPMDPEMKLRLSAPYFAGVVMQGVDAPVVSALDETTYGSHTPDSTGYVHYASV